MNLPNKLTILRVILIVPFVVFMLVPIGGDAVSMYTAVAIFIVASLTDLLDGKIARKYNSGGGSPDLPDSEWTAFRLDFHYHHQPGIHHQRFPSGGV